MPIRLSFHFIFYFGVICPLQIFFFVLSPIIAYVGRSNVFGFIVQLYDNSDL